MGVMGVFDLVHEGPGIARMPKETVYQDNTVDLLGWKLAQGIN